MTEATITRSHSPADATTLGGAMCVSIGWWQSSRPIGDLGRERNKSLRHGRPMF